jgi:trimethylamine--corrinoid protein Co-methyltransferase
MMETEYLYPQLADRGTYNEWKDTGKRDAYEIAHEKVKKILSEHYPVYIDPAADAKIRERFPIALKPEDMKSGSGRW